MKFLIFMISISVLIIITLIIGWYFAKKKKGSKFGFKVKKGIFICLLGVLTILALFLFQKTANADVWQVVNNYTTPYLTSNLIEPVGQLTGTLTKIKLWSLPDMSVDLGSCSNNWIPVLEASFEGCDDIEWSAFTTSTANFYICDDAYCVDLNLTPTSTRYYWLYLYGNQYAEGSNVDIFEGSLGCHSLCVENMGDLKDIAFYLYGVNSSYGTSDFIQIIRPENTTTTTNEAFLGNFWGVNVSANSLNCSVGSPCKIDVYYYGENTPIYNDWTALYSTSTFEKYFPKVNLLNSGIYSAKAYLYDSFVSSTLIASSSFITFTIATSTPQGVQEACSSGGWLENAMCSVLYFLFKPSQTSFDSIETIKDRIVNKPPVGYFTIIKNKISNIGVGTSTYAILNASATEAFSGIFNPVKTGLTWFFWLFFGFWVFNRVRHFEL